MKQTAIEILTWIGIQLIKAGLIKLQKLIEKIDEKDENAIPEFIEKVSDADKRKQSYTQQELPLM